MAELRPLEGRGRKFGDREREREGDQVRPLYREGGGDDQPVGQLQGPEKSSRNHEWLEQLISIMIWLTGAIN